MSMGVKTAEKLLSELSGLGEANKVAWVVAFERGYATGESMLC
jgi:hypothetical protein